MLAPNGFARFKGIDSTSIDQIRIVATVLLVSYHVIGWPISGLRIQNPHPLRIFADSVADFRMPAFAFIAGLVYAIRPPDIATFGTFVGGKLRRLAVPGLIAALIFDAISTTLDLRWVIPPTSLWHLVVYPYAHFWFLQSILVLFVVVGLFDATSRHRADLLMLCIATLLSLSQLPLPPIFSIANAFHLAPFFLAGISYTRHRQWIEQRYRSVTVIAVALIAVWAVWTIVDYAAEGRIVTGSRQLQALMFGLSACTLMLFYLPHMSIARKLGAFCFTIYLYHVLATAGTRMLLFKLGIDSLAIHLVAGTAGGLIFPIAIHLCAMRSPLAQRLILGVGRKPDQTASDPGRPRPAVGLAARSLDPVLASPRTHSAPLQTGRPRLP